MFQTLFAVADNNEYTKQNRKLIVIKEISNWQRNVWKKTTTDMAGTTANCWNKKHLLDYFTLVLDLGSITWLSLHWVWNLKKKPHGCSPPHFYAWQESVLTDLWCIVSSVTNSLIMLLVLSIFFFSNTDNLTIISRAMSGHIFIWISSFFPTLSVMLLCCRCRHDKSSQQQQQQLPRERYPHSLAHLPFQ